MQVEVAEIQGLYPKLALTLHLEAFKVKISVITCMTVLDNEKVIKTEHNEFIFCDGERWTFSNSLTIEEMTKNKFTLILFFKIVPGTKYKQCLGTFQNWNLENVVRMPTTRLNQNFQENILERDIPGTLNKVDDSFTVLKNELMCLYQNQNFSDFQLQCGNICFPVHKNILDARSPVFKTMLSCDMLEAASGCMDIVDLKPSTLALFLTFIYTGTVVEEGLQGESVLNLYYAADKYQVPSLKMECVDFLSSNVNISNVCNVLSLSNRHHDEQLTNVARDFILNNYNEVLASIAWKDLMRSDPFLAAETLTYFAERKYVRKS